MKNSLLHISAVIMMAFGSLHGQYISSVSYPDSNAKVIQNEITQRASTITAEDLKTHLYTLASDEFGGRELGTEGNTLAAEYISDQFDQIGLEKLPGTDSYFQEVDFTWIYWDKINMFINDKKYKQLWDFVAYQDKNKGGEINTNEVVFLGYGIDDPNYSDYKRAKVENKVILIYNGEPLNKSGNYRVNKTNTPSAWSEDINLKLQAAKEHGVRHVLIVADNLQKLVEDNRRQLLGAKVILGKPEMNHVPVDFTYISSTMAKEILGKKTKKVIKRKKCITKRGKSKPIKVKTQLKLLQKKNIRSVQGMNVAGMVTGSTLPEEYVFMTAHYDHIGKKGKDINNGADDNASGTSTVLELAEAYTLAAEAGMRPKRSTVFMLVTGEEKGLLGSDFYVENPIIPLQQTVVDINIDMVGRVHKDYEENPNYIFVIGSDRLSKELHEVNEEVNNDYSQLILDYRYNDENDRNRFYYRSDHYNFARKGVPAIFFFNGTHEDYHRPSDTAEKINYEKMAKIGRHIFHLSWELADKKSRITVDQ